MDVGKSQTGHAGGLGTGPGSEADKAIRPKLLGCSSISELTVACVKGNDPSFIIHHHHHHHHRRALSGDKTAGQDGSDGAGARR